MVDTGLLTWADVARVMARTPARIGRRPDAGTPVAAGQAASLTLYDPRPTRPFVRDDLHGRSVHSPYRGRELPGQVRWTFFAGAAPVADGRVRDEPGVPA